MSDVLISTEALATLLESLPLPACPDCPTPDALVHVSCDGDPCCAVCPDRDTRDEETTTDG